MAIIDYGVDLYIIFWYDLKKQRYSYKLGKWLNNKYE